MLCHTLLVAIGDASWLAIDPLDVFAAVDELLIEMLRAPEWFRDAACRGQPISVFFPRPGEPGEPYSDAKQLCDRCPVRSECLAYALETNAVGFWGGTSRYQREQMPHPRQNPQRSKALHGTA
jgi:WhiB family transcriptional regulator, redox-sensing transcriptional regulator